MEPRQVLAHSESITKSAKSFWSPNTNTKGCSFTFTGVQLWIHGVQCCHGWKCDPVFGNCGQVKTFSNFTSVNDFSFILFVVPVTAIWLIKSMIILLYSLCWLIMLLPGCWVKKLTQERKPRWYTKSPNRKSQDVAERIWVKNFRGGIKVCFHG